MTRRLLSAVALFTLPLAGNVKLPALISDHMLLQQQMPVRIWGKGLPAEKVSVEINRQHASATANPAGSWEVFLPSMKAGGPYEMYIRGANQLVIHDVLIGEVWVGSGQSNMGLPMTNTSDAEARIATANDPWIRFFDVKERASRDPLDDVEGQWVICTPTSVRNFSAVGYYFSKYARQASRFPIGFIHASSANTAAVAWTARSVLDAHPALATLQSPGLDLHSKPSGFWNGMIAPLTPYSIRGVIWYQGEREAGDARAFSYRELFRFMIEDWRRQWAEGDFPFLFVQIANLHYNENWPVLRESQAEALKLRNTAMVVTVDIGESDNIHPKNKQEVGRRLALSARYDPNIEYSGPVFRKMTKEGRFVHLFFDHVGGALQSRGGKKLLGFEIAGKVGEFAPAEAHIEGSAVVVSSPQIPFPSKVRYAWADDPECTLENRDGLPASPFRADLE